MSFGWMKPATPDTSLMRTVAARMPSGSSAEIDAPCPSAEILPLRIGSLTAIGISATRFLPGRHQLLGVGERSRRDAGVRIIDEPYLVGRDVRPVGEGRAATAILVVPPA